jgi:hypothetical protein
MNPLQPFEPRLVISPVQSPENAEQVFQSAEEAFKAGLGIVKVIGIGLGVRKDRRPVYLPKKSRQRLALSSRFLNNRLCLEDRLIPGTHRRKSPHSFASDETHWLHSFVQKVGLTCFRARDRRPDDRADIAPPDSCYWSIFGSEAPHPCNNGIYPSPVLPQYH